MQLREQANEPGFAPVIQPTLDTGTQALVVAAPAWLAAARGQMTVSTDQRRSS